MATTINASTSAGLVSTADTSGVLQLQAQGTTVLNGELGKALALQGATSTTGCGIAFPATQVTSTDANTLDDYEEGTWTPNQGSGITVNSGTFTSSGSYTKVGRLVTVILLVQSGIGTISITASGIICTNLPFPVSGISYQTGSGTNWNFNLSQGCMGFNGSGGLTLYNLVAYTTVQGVYYSLTYTTT